MVFYSQSSLISVFDRTKGKEDYAEDKEYIVQLESNTVERSVFCLLWIKKILYQLFSISNIILYPLKTSPQS